MVYLVDELLYFHRSFTTALGIGHVEVFLSICTVVILCNSLLLLLLLLCGGIHLSMPRHDYVKSGRLAVTDKTKPIYIYLHI